MAETLADTVNNVAQAYQYKQELLHLGNSETPIADTAKDYKSPYYLYDLRGVQDRCRLYLEATKNVQSFFAIKANANGRVLKVLREAGLGCDVVSGGELKRAIEFGFSPGKIVFSGVGKTTSEIEEALRAKVLQLNAESVPELLRIQQIALRLGRNGVRVALRYNPDVDAKTHKYISTGLRENKFGLADEELAEAVALFQAKSLPNLELTGLSMHLGSQLTDANVLREGVQKLVKKATTLREKFPDLKVVDIGGGLGIDYESPSFAKEHALIKEYKNILSTEVGDGSWQLQAEPGRFLVGRFSCLVGQVQYIKVRSDRQFVVLDCGMNHLMRPALYQATHRLMPLRVKAEDQAAAQVYDVVGPICESTDVFLRQVKLPRMREGDLVAIMDTGAYGFTLANQYNLHALPEERFLTF